MKMPQFNEFVYMQETQQQAKAREVEQADEETTSACSTFPGFQVRS